MDRIKEMFFEHPDRKFTVRDIEKFTKVPKSTVQNYVKMLRAEGLIKADNSANDTITFKIKKTNYFVEKILDIGLIDFLIEKMNPEVIILFGSFRKGESNKESDLDLFIVSHSKPKLDLGLYEKRLKHTIDLHIENSISKLHDNLLNNIVNGIKLYGSFKVK